MNTKVEELIRDHGGISLDIACGEHKQGETWVGLDIQDLPGVDIVCDLNDHPWPLPDDCVLRAIASHIVEHIPKVAIQYTASGNAVTHFPLIEFMNDVWRVMKAGGEFAIAVPHGYSSGFLQDPTHSSGLNETTWAYFNPEHPFYSFYKPKPWKPKFISWDPSANLEVVLIKLAEKVNDGQQ
jgi:predicted SAM-dependent methyltransferase